MLNIRSAPAISFNSAAAVPYYSYSSSAPVELTQVAKFDHQVTGVSVSKDGRIFVNLPRWTEDTVVSAGKLKDGEVVAFPDVEWNAWRNAKKDEIDPKNHWVCVQSVVADRQGNIWVLDPAAPAMASVVAHGPKLVEIDLETNKPARIIAFDNDVAPQGSYLNDVRFSSSSCFWPPRPDRSYPRIRRTR